MYCFGKDKGMHLILRVHVNEWHYSNIKREVYHVGLDFFVSLGHGPPTCSSQEAVLEQSFI